MITTNVIFRTFHLKWREETGTGFAIDKDSRQYLVTARHVVTGIQSGDEIEIYNEKKWKRFAVNVVGIGRSNIDVAVLACSFPLCDASYPLAPSVENMTLGQAVSFLGYPFGWDGGGEYVTNGRPVPFVKAGIVSAVESEDGVRIFLDAHGNRGFSGGPVVFTPGSMPPSPEFPFQVAGVVSCYPVPLLEPIVDSNHALVTNQQGAPIGYVRENPGIVVAINIRRALDLIDDNPVGFRL